MHFFKTLSFTQKYIIALTLIALLSTLAYFNLLHLIESQADDGRIINMSGKQRMLSQKIALYALHFDPKELQKSIDLMESSHNILLHRKMSKRVAAAYFEEPLMLDHKVKEYISNAKVFLAEHNQESLEYLLQHSKKLLEELDYLVSIYQQQTEAKTRSLKQNELYILLVTLVMLLLEALFIFRPINQNVLKKSQKLHQQKQYLDMIIDTNTNALIAVDESLKILTFNKSAEKIFGYSAAEMLYTELTDDRIIPRKYLQQHNRGLKNFVKTGTLKNRDEVFELEAQRKDGTHFPIRISFGVNIENNRRIVVANIQDITAEKEKDEILLAQSRLAAMGEMIGNIAHQWRQPLSSISAVASGTKLRYKNGLLQENEVVEAFDKIKEYTQYLSTTIDDFRNFFAPKKSEEHFRLYDVIVQSLSLVEAAYKAHGITIETDIEDKDVLLKGSSSELSQVILNILNNAKDVLIERNAQEKIVLLREWVAEDKVFISIIDNAGGIDDAIKHKVYEPYFTTKHQSQGTGIGLFMSQKIIQQHFNGTLSNKNSTFTYNGKEYKGAEFTIVLNKEEV